MSSSRVACVCGLSLGVMALLAACGSAFNTGSSGDAGPDVTTTDGPGAGGDAGLDAGHEGGHEGAAPESGVDAEGGSPATVYSELDAGSSWDTLDLTSVGITSVSFVGAVFDGHYLYFVPSSTTSPVVARFDTTQSLGAGASWTTFNLTGAVPGGGGYLGGVFDGRYVYFAPQYDQPGRLVVRYDTQAPFASPGSWSTFGFEAAFPGAGQQGFFGAAYDGRDVYLVPFATSSTTPTGVVARYDTHGALADGGGWTVFNAETVNPGAAGFAGGVFDGRFVTFVPLADVNGAYDGIAARFDTQAAFVDAGAWATFDIAGLGASAVGFVGGVFDGRYVYAVPSVTATVARHDTTSAFDAGWSAYDLAPVSSAAGGFHGGAFDGRYVYLVPYYNHGAYDGLVARYDTTAAGFGTSSAWSFFDLVTLDAKAVGFNGAAFDGTYLYFVPYAGTVLARFRAKSPPSVPSAVYGGSFL